MHCKTSSIMKLTTYLTLTAAGIAAWMFFKKGTTRAKLAMPRPKRARPVHHSVHHKRNGMKTHSAH